LRTHGDGRDALVVEDDDGAMDVAQGLLGALGYRVRAARNGREGLEAIAVRIPDLILLDVCLPEMDGPSFLRVLSRVEGADAAAVVAVSAVYPADGAVARQLRSAGVTQYLEKPFTLARLRAAVAEAHPDGPASRSESDVGRTGWDLGVPCWTLTQDGRRELVLESVGDQEVTIVAPRGLMRVGLPFKIECRVGGGDGSVRVRMLAEAVRKTGGRGGGERWTLQVRAVTPNGGLGLLATPVATAAAPPPARATAARPPRPARPEPQRSATARRVSREQADRTRRGRSTSVHEVDPATGMEAGSEQEEVPGLDAARALFLETLRSGAFKLPLMPGTVREAIDLTRNPKSSFIGLSNVIEKDPPLTAQLLRLANSPLFGGRSATGGLRMALTRIGLRGIREVLLLASVADIMVVPGRSALTRRLQDRAVGAALACHGVAHRADLDDDAAFTAGVLHDVGWPITFGLIRQLRAQLPTSIGRDHEVQLRVTEALHGELGLELAVRWGLPDGTAHAIGYHHDPTRAPSDPKLAFCVQAARVILDRVGLHPEDRVGSMVGCEGFEALGLTDDDVKAIGEDVRHRLGLPYG
jgi:HD-like signal output (HDOD) protein/CheY-like chemotaxis protein